MRLACSLRRPSRPVTLPSRKFEWLIDDGVTSGFAGNEVRPTHAVDQSKVGEPRFGEVSRERLANEQE